MSPGPGSGPVGARPAGRGGDWHRLHPLSPFVRSWHVLVIAMVIFGQEAAKNFVSHGGEDSQGSGVQQVSSTQVLEIVGVVALGLLVVVGLMLLSWSVTRFRVTDQAIEINSGVLSRRHRSARLDRLQAVDVVQPFVARIVGLAKLDVEVAGGQQSKVALAYLTENRAQALRNELLARAAGVTFETDQVPVAPERPVLEVPVPRLLASLILSSSTIVLMLLLVSGVAGAIATGNPGPLSGVLASLVGLASVVWNRFNRGFAFRVAVSPDGIRVRHGLLEHRAQTLPPGRVQAVRFVQPLLWRPAGWWLVRVTVAGYGQRRERAREVENILLPVGTLADAGTVLSLVLPDLGELGGDDPWQVFGAGLTGSGAAHGFVTSPARARWLDPLAWRRNGFRVTGAALLLRGGWLHRRLDVVPHAKTQSVALTQGPLERALDVAVVELHSTAGPIRPRVLHLDAHRAAGLLGDQADRARAARSTDVPDRWMASPDVL